MSPPLSLILPHFLAHKQQNLMLYNFIVHSIFTCCEPIAEVSETHFYKPFKGSMQTEDYERVIKNK